MPEMTRRRVLTAFALSAVVALVFPNGPEAQSAVSRYAVDPTWPKPLPKGWVLGGLGGVCVDAQDHVFILNRPDAPDADLNARTMAPLIIEFDPSGQVVNSWGDPALLDARLHSCYADKDNNIWMASSPSGMVQKYSHDGRTLLLQIGKKGVLDSSDGTANGRPLNSNAPQFFMPSSIYVDPQNGDVYVADGEAAGGNQRVAVMDRNGRFLRQWRPDGMETVHCLIGTNDGWIYVCNRQHGRIQVYDKAGRFMKHIPVPWTPATAPSDGKPIGSGGSATAFDLSRDEPQRLMFVINQANTRVEVMDRPTGALLTSFGRPGHAPGEFDQPHGIAVDARGNVYVAENRGKRVQKFIPGSGGDQR